MTPIPARGHQNSWWRVLWIGMLAYFVGIFVLLFTANPVIFPTVVMIGCFTVPVAYVAFFYERRHLSLLNMPTTVKAFLYGGVLGVFAAAILEPLLIGELNVFSVFLVGLIEEFAKILGVVAIARRLRRDLELDGLILGAAAGMGFASLESNGYAFSAFLSSHGSLSITVALTLLRAFLSPVGHGTWTAIFASVLFRESQAGHFRFNHKVLGAYLTVSLLHGLWDGLPGALAGLPYPGLNIFLGEAIVGGIGFWILYRRWREALRVQVSRLFSSSSSFMTKEPPPRPPASP